MTQIKCPWMMCVYNSSEEINRPGKCNFEGKVEFYVPDVRNFIESPPGELIHAELMECKNYKYSRNKHENIFKEE